MDDKIKAAGKILSADSYSDEEICFVVSIKVERKDKELLNKLLVAYSKSSVIDLVV